MTTPPLPADLGPSGRAMWADVTGRFEIDVPELAVLSNACRTADLLDALAERIPDDMKAVSEFRHHLDEPRPPRRQPPAPRRRWGYARP